MTQYLRDVTSTKGLTETSEKFPFPTANSYPNAQVITKSDSTTYDPPIRALYVGGTGNISVDMAGGQTAVLFSTIPAGTIIPVTAVKVNSTNTTATTIVGLW
jgi:hypothetical protein